MDRKNTMTLDDFEEELKALLRRTREAGLDSNQVVEVGVYIISDGGWEPTK
jgi:hypothetical protein